MFDGLEYVGPLKYARQFFRSYYYDEALEDPTSLEEALDDYLGSEQRFDPHGRMLLRDLRELRDTKPDHGELARLIEQEWGAQSDCLFHHLDYREVINEICAYLDHHIKQVENG